MGAPTLFMSNQVQILVSTDSFLIQDELESIQKEVLDPSAIDFNFDRFSAKSDSVNTIIDACRTLPMMGNMRLVIVRDAESINKDEGEAWQNYFSKSSPTTKLVLVADKIDKRIKLWQQASKRGWVKELKVPFQNQLPQWVIGQASKRGLTLSVQAAYALADSIGCNLMALISAIEKLEIFATPRKKIEMADVEALAGGFLSKSIFDFTDKVGSRNFKEAQSLLDQIMVTGEPPGRILFMMTRHFRILLLAQEAVKNGLSENEAAQMLGVHPFFVKTYVGQAKKIPFKTLRKIYEDILVADRSAKSSPLHPRYVIDRFLMQTCLGG